MAGTDSRLTDLIARAHKGSDTALNEVLSRFRERLVRVIGANLRKRGIPTGRIDPSDVVNSAFLKAGERISDPDSKEIVSTDHLWHLLLRSAENKCADHIRGMLAAKRGRGTVKNEAALEGHVDGEVKRSIEQFAGSALPPDVAASFDETIEAMLGAFPDDSLERRILKLLIAGVETNTEISKQLEDQNGKGPSRTTVFRKRMMIADTLQELGLEQELL